MYFFLLEKEVLACFVVSLPTATPFNDSAGFGIVTLAYTCMRTEK